MNVTTKVYSDSSEFNYRALIFFFVILVIGILQLFQRNRPVEKLRPWPIFWAILVAAFAILIGTVIIQKKQIEKLEKIEQSKGGIK